MKFKFIRMRHPTGPTGWLTWMCNLLLLYLSPLFWSSSAGRCSTCENTIGAAYPTAGYQWKDLRQRHPGTDDQGDATQPIHIAIAYRSYDTLWGWRLSDIEPNPLEPLLLFLLQDLCYWLFHFASHHVRWLWAHLMWCTTAWSGSTFHCLSPEPDVSVSGMWLFWILMILIGFPRRWGHRTLSLVFSSSSTPGGGQAGQT